MTNDGVDSFVDDEEGWFAEEPVGEMKPVFVLLDSACSDPIVISGEGDDAVDDLCGSLLLTDAEVDDSTTS